jgi:hypothetical protein
VDALIGDREVTGHRVGARDDADRGRVANEVCLDCGNLILERNVPTVAGAP